MLEEQVVVLPEAALRAGALGGHRGEAGVLMHELRHRRVARRVEREVMEAQLHVLLIARQDLLQAAVGVGTVAALEVGEFDQRHDGVGLPFAVAAVERAGATVGSLAYHA